jgi:hypothetical protein
MFKHRQAKCERSSCGGRHHVFEDLANAANGMFSNFWLVVIMLLPFILAMGWIIQWFEG